MFCSKCGARLDGVENSCAACGASSGLSRRSALLGLAAGSAVVGGVVVAGLTFGSEESEPPVAASEAPSPAPTPAPPTQPLPTADQAPVPTEIRVEADLSLARSHSEDLYATIVDGSIPFGFMQARSKAASFNATMTATETDVMFDDKFQRTEPIVLLGHVDEDWTLAFVYRYLVDHTYPHSKHIKRAGKIEIGRAEWRKRLAFGGSSFDLEEVPSDGPTLDTSTAWWEPAHDDHDAALIYLPRSRLLVGQTPNLNIPNPKQAVSETLANAGRVFGLGYTLISANALTELQTGANSGFSETEVGLIVVGVALGALFFAPLVGSVAGGSAITPALLSSTNPVVAKLLPIAVDVGKQLALQAGALAVHELAGGEPRSVPLLGVRLPDDGAGLELADSFLHSAMSHHPTSVVPFDGTSHDGSAQVFVPSRKMNINLELLMRGLARLDTEDTAAVDAFPQLARGALDAIDQKRGLAVGWAEDPAYVGAVRRLATG